MNVKRQAFHLYTHTLRAAQQGNKSYRRTAGARKKFLSICDRLNIKVKTKVRLANLYILNTAIVLDGYRIISIA